MKKKRRRRFKHNVIAIVYDFDGTLTPQPMQEYTVLPKIGIKGRKFWDRVKQESVRTGGEEIVTYMRLMLDLSNTAQVPITRQMLKGLAKDIKFFKGLSAKNNFFNRINKFVRKYSKGKVKVRHYLLSAGLKEILEGIAIRKHFFNIFASEYFYNHYGAAVFPKIIVNDTLKTQFLFRINKGKEKIHENINVHMAYKDRAIPFQNILYIGDGLTDVPCMTVAMKEGGYAIAVHARRKGLEVCKELWNAKRVYFITKADYRPGGDLDIAVKTTLQTMIQGVRFTKACFDQYLKNE